MAADEGAPRRVGVLSAGEVPYRRTADTARPAVAAVPVRGARAGSGARSPCWRCAP